MAWNRTREVQVTAHADRGLTAVARGERHMHLWWPRDNGALLAARWDGTYYVQAMPQLASVSPSGHVAAVSRHKDTFEVFWIAHGGEIRHAFWYEGQLINDEEHVHPLTPRGAAATDGGLAVVSRRPDTMELWWIAPDGVVHGKHWYEGDPRGWVDYTFPGFASTAGGPSLTAVARKSEGMDVFWIRGDGGVHGASWDPVTRDGFHTTVAKENAAELGGGISAVSRQADAVELWWITPQGNIAGAFSYGRRGNWITYPMLADPGSAASLSGRVAAVSHRPESMAVAYIGADQSVHAWIWNHGAGWRRERLASPGTTPAIGGRPPGGSVAAASLNAGSFSIYWTGGDKTGNTIFEAEWTEPL